MHRGALYAGSRIAGRIASPLVSARGRTYPEAADDGRASSVGREAGFLQREARRPGS